MEPREFNSLEQLARKRGSSVSDLVREAARAQFLIDVDGSRRERSAEGFLSLPDTRLPEWKNLKKEIEQRRGKDVSRR
jgi:hypothetical protein